MAKVRKNYWLDPDLLARAKAALGATTETETVAEALRRVAEGEELARTLAEGRGAFPTWADPSHEARQRGDVDSGVCWEHHGGRQ